MSDWIAFVPGACTNNPQDIHSMMRVTHDGVIRNAGPGRRSGVTWKVVHGCQCRPLLDALYEDLGPDPALTAGLDQYHAFLTEHGDRAVLVVAMVEVER